MTEEKTSGVLPHQYENRLVCFIDLLGFKNKVIQAQYDAATLGELFGAIEAVQTSALKDAIYGGITHISSDRKVIQVADDPKVFAHTQMQWPMSVTQFSDSFVISCPADNKRSCGLVIQLVFGLYRLFFKELDILVRGGVALGPLIHFENGPLFGPAMNQAYYLESEVAIYPRLLFSEPAYDHLINSNQNNSYINAIFTDSDGLRVANLVTMIVDAPSPMDYGIQELDQQLQNIDVEIDSENMRVKTKIAYLRTALRVKQNAKNSSSGVETASTAPKTPTSTIDAFGQKGVDKK